MALSSGRLSTLFSVVLLVGGCSAGGTSKADVGQARRFEAFPLYWAGPQFEKWELEAIDSIPDPCSRICNSIRNKSAVMRGFCRAL